MMMIARLRRKAVISRGLGGTRREREVQMAKCRVVHDDDDDDDDDEGKAGKPLRTVMMMAFARLR
jgi:hypothetical protein